MTHAELQALQNGIPKFHAEFCRLTGFTMRLTFDKIMAWEAWMRNGWTIDDLELVVSWIKREIKAERRWPVSLTFRKMIEDAGKFEEDLSMARAMARVPKPNHARQSVLAATGRTEEQPDNLRTAGAVAKSIVPPSDAPDEIKEGWRKLKESLR